jgi:hypothetical protein
MDKVTRDTLLRWAKKHGWLYVNEMTTPNVRQDTWLTPGGDLTLAVYELDGTLQSIAHPPMPVIVAAQGPLSIPGILGKS